MAEWRNWVKHAITGCYLVVLVVVIPFLIWPIIHTDASPKQEAMVIASIFALLTLPISAYSVINHLVNFTQPELQRPIVRVLLMVPIYTIDSYLALRFTTYAIYFNTLREWYEAYAIYNFMALVMRYLQQNYDMRYILEYKPQQRHLFPFCCLPSFPQGPAFIEACKNGVLQYSLIRTVTTMIAFMTQLFDCYGEGSFALSYSYPYLVFINNISQIWAMYCLILFYYVMRVELRPMNPLAKFTAIKLAIFLTFWQSVLIAILVYFEVLVPKSDWAWKTQKALTAGLQDFMIVIEMFLLSLAHHYAFPVEPFSEGVGETGIPWHSNIQAVMDHSDVRGDVAEHVRVIGYAVQGGANRARTKIGDILCSQAWPPGRTSSQETDEEQLLSQNDN